jgi:hypothetical protein
MIANVICIMRKFSSTTTNWLLLVGRRFIRAIFIFFQPGIIGCLSSLEDLRLECNDISYLPPVSGLIFLSRFILLLWIYVDTLLPGGMFI